MKVGLLGFPQAGKKTFFALLTNRRVAAGGRLPVKAGEALEGIAPIRDPRVDVLSGIFKPEKTRYAENTIVLCPDIDPKSAGAERAWLESARHCDLLCLVVRAFSSSEVYHPLGEVNPERDRSSLESELLIADLEIIEKRLERIGREKKSGQSPQQVIEEKCLLKARETIEKEMRFNALSLSKPELEAVKSLGLIVLKPVIWAYNVDEDKLGAPRPDNREAPCGKPQGIFAEPCEAKNAISSCHSSFGATKDPPSGKPRGFLAKKGEHSFAISCRIEEEIMGLENPAERALYLKDLGVESSGLDRLNQAAYDALGLMSFYTVGKDEVRAWTIRKGSTAPEAAGKVHSDIERGFIRAEVIKFDDLVAAGSEETAKAQGKMQVKGRDYVVADGNICHFRFNV